MNKIIFVLQLCVCLCEDETFKANIRASISDVHIQGYVMFGLLDDRDPEQIMSGVTRLMKDGTPAVNRLRIILDEAMKCGKQPVCSASKNAVTWRDARLTVANHHLLEYRKSPSVLDRIIAIDETTIKQGKIEMIAAAIRYRFIATTFMTKETARADSSAITAFITDVLAPEVTRRGIKDPIIIWDNIGIHKSKETTDFFTNNGWTVWAHPVNSADMNPLDYADFKALKSAYRKNWPADDDDIQAVETCVRKAIAELDGQLRGIGQLPDVWEALTASDGLYTRK